MKNIPFVSLTTMHTALREELLAAMGETLDGGEFILGSKVAEFEQGYAAYCGTKYAIGVSNGLDALKICLKALHIGAGDEVIVPAHTYIATVYAVLEVGATPILVDVDEHTYNITAEAIAKVITPKTKAIIPVHLYGQVCEMDPIMALAAKYGLSVIEDNAQAQGAIYKGKRTGSIGDVNASSFYPAKNLGALGDAGAITTNDGDIDELVRRLRNVGSDKKYHHTAMGYNARMDTLQAAILEVKLKHLDNWNQQRQQTAQRYMNNLKDCNSIVLPTVTSMEGHVFHLFVIRHERRDALQQYLSEHGITTLIHYPIANHQQQALLALKQGPFPITEKIVSTCLSLPLYIGLTNEEVDYVCEKIKDFVILSGDEG